MKNKDINYFVGKDCSIFTTPLNRDFRLEGPNYLQQFFNYFLGIVESIDENGLLLSQRNNLKVYVFRDHLVAIAEEERLDPDKPEDAEIIKEFKPLPEPIKMPDLLDIDSISNIADNLKENFGK